MRHAGLLLTTIPALLLAALIFPTAPARAFEKEVVGDMVVREGESVDEVSTGWGDVTVHGRVEGNVRSGSGNILVAGPVGGDVEAGFGDVRIDGPVGGDVRAGFGHLSLDQGAEVAGKVYVGHGTIEEHPNAQLQGLRTAGMADLDEDSPMEALFSAVGWIVMALVLAAAAVLLAVVAPGSLRASARSLEISPGRSLVLGLGSFPVAIILSFLLAATIIGALLIPLLGAAYLALVVFGIVVAAYFIGSKIVLATGQYRVGDALAAVLGAVLVTAVSRIPFLGGLAFVTLALLGAGGAVLAFLARRRRRGAPRATYASYEDYLRDRPDA